MGSKRLLTWKLEHRHPNVLRTGSGIEYDPLSLRGHADGSYEMRAVAPARSAARKLSLSGKPGGVDSERVEEMVNAGQIEKVARYCETDVLSTNRVCLIYELFRGIFHGAAGVERTASSGLCLQSQGG